MKRLSSGRDNRFLPILLLICVLVLSNFAGSTFAYFTDSVSAQNVIVSGNISILQHEQERFTENGTVKLKTFTQYQEIAPLVQLGAAGMEEVAVGSFSVQMRDSTAGNYVDKIVTVENVGVNPVYIRTFIAIPTGGLKSDSPEGASWIRWDGYMDGNWNWKNGEQWHLIDDAAIGGVPYDIYIATHSGMLAPGEISAPSLLGFYVDSSLSNDDSGRYYLEHSGSREYLDLVGMEILVATQAAQTTTFESADAALNTVFGVPASDNHPWANQNITFISNDTELQTMLQTMAEQGKSRTLWLQDGTYTLSGALPSGTRIVGRGGNVIVHTSNSINGSGVEFDNLIFADNVSFTGNGEFDSVTFKGTFSASFNNPVYISECVFEGAYQWSVTADAVRDTVVFVNCTDASGNLLAAK